MNGQNLRLRRSALYVPANNQRAVAKAPGLAADVIIYDLEDAVLDEQKISSRQYLAEHLAQATHLAEIVVRINAIHTAAFFDDLEWLNTSRKIDAVLLPKVCHANEILKVKQLLRDAGFNKPIWILIETVDAVLNLDEIVKVANKNSALVFGAEDLAMQMRINHTPGRLGLLFVMTQLILYGRRAGLTILDAVFPNLDNEVGFSQSCEQARNLGFDGKTLIHPKQIDITNQLFSPTPKEIERAEKIVSAWQHRHDSHGVVLVDGDVIERLHVEQALQLLDRINHNS